MVDDPNTPENEGAEDEYEFQFYLRRVGAPFAVDVLPRMTHGEMRNPCGPVRNVDECRGDGWMRFNHPSVFANQGECIAFANNRRRLTTLVPDDY